MGACATKPKVLKDGDEKPLSQPDPPPQKEVPVEEEKQEVVVPKETAAAVVPAAVNDAPADPVVESDLPKNPSLGNLFDKESEDTKVSPGIESDKGKAVSSSQETDTIKAPEVVASGSKEALEVLPAPSATVVTDAPVEKDDIKVPEVIANENVEALPVAPTAISADVPVESEAIKAPEITEPSATIDDAPVAKENDGPTEKLDSKTSEIVPEDFADALPAPVVATADALPAPVEAAADSLPAPVVAAADALPAPVVAPADAPVDDAATEIVSKENANALENVKDENVGEKSIAGTEELYFPTNKIMSQYSEEYTDALPDAVAPTLNNSTNPVQSIEQSGEEKLNPAQEDAKPLNIEDKKTVEVENAVEKQAESINPTPQESDVKQAKPVEILPDK